MSAQKISPFKFFLSLLLCLGGGFLSGLVTNQSVQNWYPTVSKSPLTPPDITFPIVWTFLYALIAGSFYLVWVGSKPNKSLALKVFIVQLMLNFLWPFLFFYMQSPFLALINNVFLLAAVIATDVLFWQQSRTAALLLLPYLGWITFALYLTGYIWRFNP